MIEHLIRSKFIIELKHMQEKNVPNMLLERVARIKSRKDKYIMRLQTISKFLLANCIDEPRVEVKSWLPEIGD